MKVNRKKALQIMEDQGIDAQIISTRTGLYPRSVKWILDNGDASEEAVERIADCLGVPAGEILAPEPLGVNENVIEFLKDQERAIVTFSQGRYKTVIERLAERFPDECQVVARNKDGSLLAHVPTEWVKIRPNKAISDELKANLVERLRGNNKNTAECADEND